MARTWIRKLAGKFLVIDGPDGAGKTTQLGLLAEFLRAEGVAVRQVRDPGGTVVGDRIRAILLDNSHTEMTIGCEILLYMASRTQLVAEAIGPAVRRKECVLCDRWVSSTVAYQVAEGNATAEEVMAVYDIAVKGTRPDLTVILDLPSEVGLARLAGPTDRIESKGLDFHTKVRALFLAQAQSAPEAFRVVEGAGAVDEVQARLREAVADWASGHA